jgi:hypothetical protein
MSVSHCFNCSIPRARGMEQLKQCDTPPKTKRKFVQKESSIGYLPLIITISDTCKNQPKRLDSDNTINLSSLIVILVVHTIKSINLSYKLVGEHWIHHMTSIKSINLSHKLVGEHWIHHMVSSKSSSHMMTLRYTSYFLMRDLKRIQIDGCRCNERLNSKTEGSKLLVYTGLRVVYLQQNKKAKGRGERVSSIDDFITSE